LRDLQLVVGAQRDAGRLLTVAQRGVEDAEMRRGVVAHDEPSVAGTASLLGLTAPGAVFAPSHAIFARRSAPTCSIGWCSSSSRHSTKLGLPCAFSSIQRWAKVPSWMSVSSERMVARTRSSITLGPLV